MSSLSVMFFPTERQLSRCKYIYSISQESALIIHIINSSSLKDLMLISFVFRVKVLVLFLCQAMLALTVCLTSWSTSPSTMDFALTSSVLVSVSCVKVSPQAKSPLFLLQ